MDECILSTSNDIQYKEHPFVAKQVVSIIDNNGGTYTGGQILFDLSSLTNSGKFASFSEAYIEVPLIMSLQANNVNNFLAITNLHFAMGIKNGFYQIINSAVIEYNNATVQQLTPYTNIYTNFKLLTSMSADDLEKHGASIGFYPDTATSWNHFNTSTDNVNVDPSANGPGVSNNCPFGWEKIYPSNNGYIYTDTRTADPANLANAGVAVVVSAATAAGAPLNGIYTTKLPAMPSSRTVANYGLYKRIQFCAFDRSQAPYSSFISQANTESVLKNYFVSGGADNYAYKAWFVMARIRLKDISDFFNKLPLVRGAYIRITLNLNLGSQAITVADINAAAGQPLSTSLIATSAPTIQGNTIPFIVSSSATGQGLQPTSTRLTAGAYIAQISVVTATLLNNVTLNHPQRNTRLYVPLYQFSPSAEIEYLSNNNKKVIYKDIYQYTVNVDTGQTFSSLLTNGLPSIENIIVCPFVATGTNRVNGNYIGATFGVPAYQSCFASEPGTTSFGVLSEFNCQLAGINAFLDNYRYDYQIFADELSNINAINGACTTGLSSGLISELDFTNIYRYYVINASRRMPAEDTIPKSVQLSGKNITDKNLQLIVFIEFLKSITIDVGTGERKENQLQLV